MRALGLSTFGYVPLLIIGALVIGAISYVLSVFAQISRITNTYFAMDLLDTSLFYASFAIACAVIATILIYIKNKKRNSPYQTSENYLHLSLIFFGSLYGLIIALFYTYISIQMSRFHTLSLATFMAYILQFIVLYQVITLCYALLTDAWRSKKRILKVVWCLGVLSFVITAVIV